jgi:hypothetical protein
MDTYPQHGAPSTTVDSNGTQRWYLNGQLHREDGPAVILSDGTQYWCCNGQLHREDGPAVIYSDGTQLWYRNDRLHREDGPAAIWTNGTQLWYWQGRQVDAIELFLLAGQDPALTPHRVSVNMH